MGKGEEKPAESEDEKADSPAKEEKEPETSDDSPEKTNEVSEEKKDVESLRKVIKVDQADKSGEKTEEKEPEETKKEEEKPAETDPEPTGRESLEQKRAILQNIKDFDFQIKKNQEDIGGVHKKLDSMSKDLDDLVSLYEIVSEQMNPFVGLSKVTKKRLDALENFTREIETLKERTGELESFAEKSGSRIQRLGEGVQQVKTINTDAIIAQMDDKLNKDKDKEGDEKTGETDIPGEKTVEEETEVKKEETGEVKTSEGEEVKEKTEEKVEIVEEPEEINEEEPVDISNEEEMPEVEEELEIFPITEDSEDIFTDGFFNDASSQENFNATLISSSNDSVELTDDSFDMDLDMIFKMVFGSLNDNSFDTRIDAILDEFIESLKG